MLNQVIATRCGDHLLVVDIDQPWELSDRSIIAAQMIGLNDLWDIVFTQEPDQKGLCSLSIAVALEEDIKHEAVLVHCSPAVKRAQARYSDQDEPMSDVIDARTHLILSANSKFPVFVGG